VGSGFCFFFLGFFWVAGFVLLYFFCFFFVGGDLFGYGVLLVGGFFLLVLGFFDCVGFFLFVLRFVLSLSGVCSGFGRLVYFLF